MWLFDISRSSNYSSEIYRKWIWLIYLARVISQARYIIFFTFSYISLEKLLERDLSSESIFDISCSNNYLREIYQPNPFSIYLAWVITRARISNNPISDISRSSNYSSKIYQTISFPIYIARVITRVRYIKQSHFRYISLE